jgi:hypothetical protein
MPIIAKYNVSLVFYGHEHTYERYYLQNHSLICLGNGGTIMADHVYWQAGTQAIGFGPSFAKITCNSTGIQITLLSPTMNLMDSVFLMKNGSAVTPDAIVGGM